MQEQGILPGQHATSVPARVSVVSGHHQQLAGAVDQSQHHLIIAVHHIQQLLKTQHTVQAGAGDLVAESRGAGGEEGWVPGRLRAGLHQATGPKSSPERLHDAALHGRHTAVQPCRVSSGDAWSKAQQITGGMKERPRFAEYLEVPLRRGCTVKRQCSG